LTNGNQKKTRSELVAGLDPVPKFTAQLWRSISRSDVVLRLTLCLLAAIIMAVATRAWAPPFAYRRGDTPQRDIVARVAFQIPNNAKVESAKEDARKQARHVYVNDPQQLLQLRARLRSEVAVLVEAEALDADTEQIWSRFLPSPTVDATLTDEENERRLNKWRRGFEQFRFALSDEGRLKFDDGVEAAFVDLDAKGLFEKPEADEKYPGNQVQITVYPKPDFSARQHIEVKDVQIAFAKPMLHENLRQRLQELQTEVEQNARQQARQTFVHNPQPLIELQTKLSEHIDAIAAAMQYDEAAAKIWLDFLPPASADEGTPEPSDADDERKKQFEQFRTAIPDDPSLDALKTAIAKVLAEYEMRGLLVEMKSAEDAPEGHREEIFVVLPDDPATRQIVAVKQVRWSDVKASLRERLEKEITSLEVAGRVFTWLERRLPAAVTLQYRPSAEGETGFDLDIATLAYDWLEDQLPVTLTRDEKHTDDQKEEAAASVDPAIHATTYDPADSSNNVIAAAGKALDDEAVKRLRAEYDVVVANLSPAAMTARTAAVIGMYLALFTLCGLFIYYRLPELLIDTRRFVGLLAVSLLAVMLAYVSDNWKVELIPMLLFGMTVAICYRQDLALLLSAVVGLVVVLSLGHGLTSFVILTAATATAILLLGRIRSRVKLVYVGLCSGAVASLTTIGVNIVNSRPMDSSLLVDAGLFGLWGVASGFAMTGLLPFIESIFGVLTEISLLELGDVAHPLLQELVRRAPGTYNHSITVASMAEAAAETIGAQGLLVRVGAYFHDIGKMLKPQYFIENQSSGDNRHESLVPAMSTLVIIAHVKDGAELAREHHLPKPIIDFIQQHHGTTLVEYFYQRASEDSQRDAEAGEVDENTFRYPGPKPQTKEAGILMLADSVESASRVLVEPAPSRIENLVEEIAMKRLLDGQLDECGLTLQEVREVQDSLVKSLTAVYHGRVKYPDQQLTA
jgi:hypothetical protein